MALPMPRLAPVTSALPPTSKIGSFQSIRDRYRADRTDNELLRTWRGDELDSDPIGVDQDQ
jgi:hypothetical protein